MTPPATDTVASTPAAIADPVSAKLLVLIVVAIAFLGTVRFAAIRSRPRD